MKQVVQSLKTGEVSLSEVPAPLLRPGGLLVATARSLLSPGTERSMIEVGRKSLIGKARERPDLVRQAVGKARREGVGPVVEAIKARLDEPRPMGYSSAGTVLEAGEGVEGFRAGDHVACAGAGYAVHAEVVWVPANLAVKIPAALPGEFDEAAFATVGSIALQGVRVADARIGDHVAVIGLGLVGLLTVQILSAAGCRVWGADPNPLRRSLAAGMGAEAACAGGEELLALLEAPGAPPGLDAVIIAASTKSDDPVRLAGELCREKGRVVVVGSVGMSVPRSPFYEKELELRISRSYGPGRYDPGYEEKGIDYPYGYVRWTEGRNMAAFLDLAAAGRLDLNRLVTHRFKIEEALAAYELIAGDGSGAALGVMLEYPEAPAAPPSRTMAFTPRPASQAPAPSHPGEVVRLGVIGAGRFASSVLLPALKSVPGAALATVCTATGPSAAAAAERFGFKAAATDPAQVLEDPTIDAVIIATRHGLHAALAARALSCGKHVFVEKPLALHDAGLETVMEASAQSPSLILMVGFNRRFSALTGQIQAFFSSGSGPLAVHYRVNAGRLAPGDWVYDPGEGGGRIIGEVCHFVDWISHLTGQAPVRVFAQNVGVPEASHPGDNVVVYLDFPEGSAGTIHYLSNGDSSVAKERAEVFGRGAVAVLEDFRSVRLHRGGRKSFFPSGFKARQDKGHAAELAAFLDAVRGGRASPVPLAEAVSATLATFAINESLRSRLPVPVQPLPWTGPGSS